MMRGEIITPLNAGPTYDPARSNSLREASREHGLLFTPVYDDDCTDCGRTFRPHQPGVTRCRRCRKDHL